MKQFIQAIALAILTVTGGVMMTSCDPCAGVVCSNGTCANGTCLCNDGYLKDHNRCVGHNEAYVGENMNASQFVVDSFSNTSVTQVTNYTIIADAADPFKIILQGFNSLANNNVTFTIDQANTDILLAETFTTAAGNTYIISGAKSGSQIQLELELAPRTYTVTINQ